ncbi:2-hydroxychromene-2-carboxylate isomerase [Paraconexibacter sp.]|uniref:2-hydroxychromene-2-carboxylate isomerase n=1 Tax=Paraconexibacter sp. TaxID=2949640 RepID=UPI003566FB62
MVTCWFDVGSPYAYLALARFDDVLPGVDLVAEPVLLGAVFAARGRASWATTSRRALGMQEVEQRAAAYGLPPVVWPDPWPNDGLRAMRAAVFATREGRGLAFARAAMRLAFAEGRSLSTPAAIVDAADACGLDPDATLAATRDPQVKDDLRARTERALALGVVGVPTFRVDGVNAWGDDQLELVAARVGAAS